MLPGVTVGTARGSVEAALVPAVPEDLFSTLGSLSGTVELQAVSNANKPEAAKSLRDFFFMVSSGDAGWG